MDTVSHELVTRYLDTMRGRRCTPDTLRTVRNVLRLAHRHLGPLADVTHETFGAWHQGPATLLAARSHRNYFSIIRNFYRWAVVESLVDEDPTARYRPPRTTKPQPRNIPEDRLEAALRGADERMFAILALAAYAGLRAVEIARLSWGDVELDASPPRAWVLGKGNRDGLVYLSTPLVRALRDLPGPRNRGPVIRRAAGRPGHNTANRVSQLANSYLHAHGIPDTLHSLRHRFVTEFNRVAGLRLAQEAARHADVSTTAGYAGIDRADLAAYTERIGRLYPSAS